MLGRWGRCGDFFTYSEITADNRAERRRVSYVPFSVAAVIARIDIEFHDLARAGCTNTCSSVSLTFSPLYANELTRVCRSLDILFRAESKTFTQFANDNAKSGNDISTNDMKQLTGTVYTAIFPMNDENLAKLLRLMQTFNRKLEDKPFPAELMNELAKINDAIARNTFHDVSHKITAAPTRYRSQATKRPPYKALADILAYEKNPKLFRAYLLDGDDPNAAQGSYRPLDYAVLRQASTNWLELLMFYGADVDARPAETGFSGVHSLSAFELAVMFAQTAKAEIIVHEHSRLMRRINPQTGKTVVTQTHITKDSQQLVSQFHYNDGRTITTELVPLSKLTAAEMDKIFELYRTTFAASDDATTKKVFQSEFSGNKLIDIIYDGSKVIGFNLFEILGPVNDIHNQYVHCWYATIDPAYRSTGLMLFLSFRLVYAYAAQTIEPDNNVGMLFLAISYNSYRLVQAFDHFPKRQSPYVNAEVAALVKAVYHPTESCSDLLTQYVTDDIRVQQATVRASSVDERIYDREMLGKNGKSNGKSRGVPVMFFVGDKNTNFMKRVAESQGIPFDAHILQYAAGLSASGLVASKAVPSLKPLQKSSQAFFNINYSHAIHHSAHKPLANL